MFIISSIYYQTYMFDLIIYIWCTVDDFVIYIYIYMCLHFLYFGGRRHEALAFKSAAPLAGSRAFETLSADSCQFLSDSKSLCWPPPLPPTLPKVAGFFALGRPMSPTLSILSRLFAVRKLIKNQTPQKPSQNLKSRIPDRPNFGFGLTFGSPFGMEFS